MREMKEGEGHGADEERKAEVDNYFYDSLPPFSVASVLYLPTFLFRGKSSSFDQ